MEEVFVPENAGPVYFDMRPGKSINESMETQASSPQPFNAAQALVSLRGLSVPRGLDRQDSFAAFTSAAEFLRKRGAVQ